ncbi:MAG: chromosomal replication initiator protein DnaA [Bdellovibrionaceae bacterium]|nr:chromosomal replication initiator protein DnaA [Pseudobdellovibrionaceae bacterium]
MEAKENKLWLSFKNYFLQEQRENSLHKHWLDSVQILETEKKGSDIKLVLQAPSDLHKRWLQENLLETFYNYTKSFFNLSCKVLLEIKLPNLPYSDQKKVLQLKQAPFSPYSFFNPLYSFENFIVGKNNELACSASLAVTKNNLAQESLNPLFIYGPSGLGKTHLLNAIGQEAQKNFPKKQFIYLSAERFLNEYISSLQNKKLGIFRKKFRKNCQFLLIDDIQILSRGKEIQEEFFHTFNELYSQKVQIVICSDQNPEKNPFLQERIKTRLSGGLMVDISYPDKETRLAILKDKLNKNKLFLSQESLYLIAQSCKKSIRKIEGVLNKIKIMTDLHGGQITFSEVKNILKDTQQELSIEEIQIKVTQAFKLSLEELKSPCRKKHIVQARQSAMYLIRKYLKTPLKDISLAFGKKDHTTVLNSIKKVEKLKTENPDFKRLLEDLQKDFHINY